MSSKNALVVPYPLAMLVCDNIWQDPYTHKFTIIGTFNALGGKNFPLKVPVFSVFVSLTDGRGRTAIRLQLIDAEEARDPVFDERIDVEFKVPLHVLELCFEARNITIHQPGEHRLKLYAGDEFIMERRLIVTKQEGGPQ